MLISIIVFYHTNFFKKYKIINNNKYIKTDYKNLVLDIKKRIVKKLQFINNILTKKY